MSGQNELHGARLPHTCVLCLCLRFWLELPLVSAREPKQETETEKVFSLAPCMPHTSLAKKLDSSSRNRFNTSGVTFPAASAPASSGEAVQYVDLKQNEQYTESNTLCPVQALITRLCPGTAK